MRERKAAQIIARSDRNIAATAGMPRLVIFGCARDGASLRMIREVRAGGRMLLREWMDERFPASKAGALAAMDRSGRLNGCK